MYDYHIHSSFSSDCQTDMEETIDMAINLGLKEICFTDHIDYEYYDPNISFDFDVKEYTDHFNKLKRKYKDRIKLLKGVELGVQPHIIQKCENVVLHGDFDFVLCSMHSCNRQDLYTGDFYKDKTTKQAYTKYFEELLYCTQNFENFSVIGHLDILKRYDSNAAKENIRDYFDIIEAIFLTLIEKNKGIEINTSGFRYSCGATMPSYEVLKFYKELGGNIITIGSDSHITDTLAYKFDYAYDMLRDIGFKYITTFEKMKPNFIKIVNVPFSPRFENF